jgi:GTPase SAR1 family protein
MTGLMSYRDHRLELGDLLRAAVVGQLSRGKSTLMNALLGEAYLPMGALPMTSVITTVRYGTRPKAMIRRHQSALPVEVPRSGRDWPKATSSGSFRRALYRLT